MSSRYLSGHLPGYRGECGNNQRSGVDVTDVLFPLAREYISSNPSQGSYNSGTADSGRSAVNTSSSATLSQSLGRVISSSPDIQNCASLTASNPSDTNPANDSSCTGFAPTHVVLLLQDLRRKGGSVVESDNVFGSGYLDNLSFQKRGFRQLPVHQPETPPGSFHFASGRYVPSHRQRASPDKSYTYLLIEIEGPRAKNVWSFYSPAGWRGCY